MIRAMVVATVLVTAGAGLAMPAVGVGPHGPRPVPVIQGEVQAKHGILRVKVIGNGKYSVIGRGVRKVATKSRSFVLQPGRYRVRASGADRTITRVRVRQGRTEHVTLAFEGQVRPLGVVSRISTAADGGEGDWSSLAGLWSPDGTQVLITSKATNLVPEPDINGDGLDIYIKTIATGEIVRVSTDSQGNQGNDESTHASWSPDGTKILFDSKATNLVPKDTNRAPDLFVKDLTSGAVQRISTDAKGRQVKGEQSNMAAWSPDGKRVAFDSYAPTLVPNDTNDNKDVFVKTLATGAIQRISVDSQGRQCEKDSRFPMWSPDGRRILISTLCAFVPDDTNRWQDGYVKNLSSGEIERVTTSSSGAQGRTWAMPDAWSPDGKHISFTSESPDLVPNDTNGVEDVFVKNLVTGELQRVSTASDGAQASSGSANSVWSPDSKRLAFTSSAPDLVARDTNGEEDTFIKSLSTGEIERVSVTPDGEEANGATIAITWSPDGDQTLIVSFGTNLVPDDTNGWFDVFIADTP